MYFIDLSLRNLEQGYVDSVALIAEVTGVQELDHLSDAAKAIARANPGDSLELLDAILTEAEGIAYDRGYVAFTRDGVQYVMTEEEEEEYDEWNGEN